MTDLEYEEQVFQSADLACILQDAGLGDVRLLDTQKKVSRLRIIKLHKNFQDLKKVKT